MFETLSFDGHHRQCLAMQRYMGLCPAMALIIAVHCWRTLSECAFPDGSLHHIFRCDLTFRLTPKGGAVGRFPTTRRKTALSELRDPPTPTRDIP